MIFQVFLTCSFATILVHSQKFSKSIQPQPRVGYSSSIVHAYPETNDVHGESSVRVNFQPQQGVAVQSNTGRGAAKYLQTNNNVPSNNFYSRTVLGNHPTDTNSFNVGYNISFSNTDNGNKRRKQTYTRANNKKLANTEVITGKSKKNEKVRAPSINIDMSPQDFVSNAFLKQKQLNSENLRLTKTPINTQPKTNSVNFPVREYASKFPSQSSKFSYNTQQNIFRDVIKATKPDPIQLGQEFQASYQTGNRWNTVAPGLEISKSIEPQLSEQTYENAYNSQYTGSRATTDEQPRNFNHDSALKTSQSFDFSNAHGELLYNENDSVNDNFSEGSEQYTQRTKNYEKFDQSPNRNNIEEIFPNQQFPDLNNVNIEAHIPARLRGIKPLPLDTSLIKDAVLTTDFREAPKDSRVIPIRFDISNIEKAMQDQLANNQNYPAQQNTFIHAPLPESPHMAGLTYKDHDTSGSQNNFRMYGKPEPVDTNQYRMGYYDRQRSDFNSDIYKIVSMRPPPVGKNVKY